MSLIYEKLLILQDLINKEVCRNIKLKIPQEDNDIDIKLGNPTTYIAWSVKDISTEFIKRIPCIAISANEIEYKDENAIINIEMSHIVYSQGTVIDNNINNDNSVYHDLINFIDKTCRIIHNIDMTKTGLSLIPDSLVAKPDAEPFGDYWLGSVFCKLQTSAYPILAEKDLL